MISYEEFKNYIYSILRVTKDEYENDNIDYVTVDLFRNSYNTNGLQFKLYDEQLENIYSKVKDMNFCGVEMCSSNSYEIAIEIVTGLRFGSIIRDSIKLSDEINGIEYEIDNPSIEYCVHLLLEIRNIKDNFLKNKIYKRLTYYLQRMFRGRQNEDSDEQEISLESILQSMIHEKTLKIKTHEDIDYDTMIQYRDSFCFEFMYKTDLGINEFQDIKSIFNINKFNRMGDLSQLDTAPLRIYSSEVVDYFKLAVSSNDSYIKYISFYHVAEYYFDEIFKRKMIKDIKSKITSPNFSYKDDEKIYDIAKLIKNRFKMNYEAGRGNELQELKYVLEEYIDIEELKDRINSMDDESVDYYENNKVTFCNAPVIKWNDKKGVFTNLSKRIYFTRNSLVHSKSGKDDERYKPYKNEYELKKEIPLMKAVAELIIIKSSRLI